MINFKQIVEEIFNTTPSNVRKFVHETDFYSNTDYYFSFGENSDYVAHFILDKTAGNLDIYFENISDDVFSPMGVTNSGRAAQVFSVVIHLIYEFFKENKEIKQIGFTSAKSDGGRTKLYNRIIDKFAKKENFTVDRSEDGEYDLFTLKKQ